MHRWAIEPLLNPLWIHLNLTVLVIISNTKREWIIFITLCSYKGDDIIYNNVLHQWGRNLYGHPFYNNPRAQNVRQIKWSISLAHVGSFTQGPLWELQGTCQSHFFSIPKNVVWNVRRAGVVSIWALTTEKNFDTISSHKMVL